MSEITHEPAEADRVSIRGADTRRFLNGLATCDFGPEAPGESRFGFFLDVKGGLLSSFWALDRGDGFDLFFPPGRGEVLRAHLARYVLRDRVEIGSVESVSGHRVLGLAPEADAPDAESIERRPFPVGARVFWGIEASALPGRATSPAEAERARIRRGEPRFGVDFGPGNLVQETGLDGLGVSYTKGCYLGQEIVARLHYRGQASKTLCRLESHDELRAGAELVLEGKPVGSITSAAKTDTGGVALAMLKRSVWQDPAPGLTFELGGGVRARYLGRVEI